MATEKKSLKPVAAKTRARCEFAKRELINGTGRAEVSRLVMTRFQVSKTQANVTLRAAEEAMAHTFRNRRNVHGATQFAKLLKTQKLAQEANDVPTLLKVLQEQNKLLGLYTGIEPGDLAALPFIIERVTSEEAEVSATNGHEPPTPKARLDPYSRDS